MIADSVVLDHVRDRELGVMIPKRQGNSLAGGFVDLFPSRRGRVLGIPVRKPELRKPQACKLAVALDSQSRDEDGLKLCLVKATFLGAVLKSGNGFPVLAGVILDRRTVAAGLIDRIRVREPLAILRSIRGDPEIGSPFIRSGSLLHTKREAERAQRVLDRKRQGFRVRAIRVGVMPAVGDLPDAQRMKTREPTAAAGWRRAGLRHESWYRNARDLQILGQGGKEFNWGCISAHPGERPDGRFDIPVDIPSYGHSYAFVWLLICRLNGF